MKARSTLLLVIFLVLATLSTAIAYHAGYRHGGDAERACWILEPTTTTALARGDVLARRDTINHPLLKAHFSERIDKSVNRVPTVPAS